MLNPTVKLQIQVLGGMYLHGEKVLDKFREYIGDATKQNLIVLDDAAEIYDTFIESATGNPFSVEDDKQSNSYKVQIMIIRNIMKRAGATK